jgi:MFS family permease
MTLLSSDVDCDDNFWSRDCTKDYCDALHLATEKAGRIMSIPYVISAILSPLMGYVVDKVGQRAAIAVFASAMLMLVHTTMALAPSLSPVVPLAGQGIAYALYASVLWPSVTLVVDESLQGEAFGIITCVQNIGLAVFPLIVAAVFNFSGKRYIPNVELFFVGCALIGTLCGVALMVIDWRTGNRLKRVQCGGASEDDEGDPREEIIGEI